MMKNFSMLVFRDRCVLVTRNLKLDSAGFRLMPSETEAAVGS
jgi:hypothetical protein